MKTSSLRLFEETEILEEAASLEGNFAKKLLGLSESYPREAAADALELTGLRRRGKFEKAGEMWFDREGFEMATPEEVARHRAERFGGRIVELCCGVGGDSIALAEKGELLAFDSDPARVEMAKHNLSVYGVEGDVRVADVEELDLPSLNADWFFFDPQRRGGGLDWPLVFSRIKKTGAEYAVKLAPNFRGSGPIEWISLRHEMREACLWSSGKRRATVLPSGESLELEGAEPPPVTGLRDFLLEPDPAVIVSRAFGELAERYPCTRIDERIAYLTSSETYETDLFSSQLRVLEKTSGDLSRVKEALRRHSIGSVDVKTRGFPVDPEEMRRELAGEGRDGVVVFTREKERRVAVVCLREDF